MTAPSCSASWRARSSSCDVSGGGGAVCDTSGPMVCCFLRRFGGSAVTHPEHDLLLQAMKSYVDVLPRTAEPLTVLGWLMDVECIWKVIDGAKGQLMAVQLVHHLVQTADDDFVKVYI